MRTNTSTSITAIDSAAWDALDAMANLFGRPLLETRTGGRAGGGACLTPAGLRVIDAFGRLEAGARHFV